MSPTASCSMARSASATLTSTARGSCCSTPRTCHRSGPWRPAGRRPPSRAASPATPPWGASFTGGFTFDFVHAPTPGCNLSKLFRPTILPEAISSRATAHAGVARGIAFRIGHRLRGTMIAFHGSRRAPRFTLTGPGVRVTTPTAHPAVVLPPGLDLHQRRGQGDLCRAARRRAGTGGHRPQQGSVSITTVLEADPLPSAPHQARKMTTVQVIDTLHYRYVPVARRADTSRTSDGRGRSSRRQVARRRGKLSLPMIPGVKRRG